MNSLGMSAQRRYFHTCPESAWPGLHVVRQACDEFVELRREPTGGSGPSLLAASAIIGRHTVLILIQNCCGESGKGKPKDISPRSTASRKFTYLIRLAKRFDKPVLVCVVDPPRSFKGKRVPPHPTSQFPDHVLSQWLLDVPIILLVSAMKVSCGIFGMWLADRSISLTHTKFIVQGRKRPGVQRAEIEASELLRCKIIDGIVGGTSGGSPSQSKMAPHKIRQLLIQLLDEMAKVPPIDLKTRRKERLDRIEALITKT